MDRKIKLVLVGDAGVGKSSWLSKLQTGEMLSSYIPTIGVSVSEHTYKSARGDIKYNIWDTAGQEIYGGLRDGYFIGADAGIVFYDANSVHTRGAASCWRRDLLRVAGGIPVVMVANKIETLPADITNNCVQNDTIKISVLDGIGILEPLEAISNMLPHHFFNRLQNYSDYFKD